MDVEKMEGRELDLQMAEVMGWDIHFAPLVVSLEDGNWLKDKANYPYIYIPVIENEKLILFTEPNLDGVKFAPSRDIAAAMLVVEKIFEKYGIQITMLVAGASVQISDFIEGVGMVVIASAEAETAPLAICRAALLAAEAE